MAERVFTQVFAAVGAIIEKDGTILLVKEAGTRDKGKWNLPAGWLDVGENPLDMVIREVREETGLVGIYSLVKHYPDDEPDKRLRHPVKLYFRGEVTGGNLVEANDEIEETRWYSEEEVKKMSSLRDSDIAQAVRDYFAGRNFSLEIIRHTVQN